MILATFLAATTFVGILTIILVRRMARSEDASVEFFTGGRALTWPIIAGSLMLTNLSTEQLVGLNGAVFGDGMLVGVAWEVVSAFAMIGTALIFLPRYLARGFTTTPAYLEARFDALTRRIVSGLFLAGYALILLPVVLYTGALALQTLFDLNLDLWQIVIGLGVVGGLYAVIGGLKAVAISDTINGVGLLIGGLAIPALALSALGEGSMIEGLQRLVSERPESLKTLARVRPDGEPVSVPWDTLLTGMIFIQVFYWSTNQVIVQRAMAAKSLAHGQKGVLFAAGLKLIGPLMLCLPGIIALHLTGELEISKNDQVYPAIVRHVLPAWSLGLFAAVMVGAILSSFNSALNSAATLFSLEFVEPRLRHSPCSESERHVRMVRYGRLFSIVLAAAAMGIAPVLAARPSIFDYLQQFNGFYSVPIITVFLVGLLSKRTPASAAPWGMFVGVIAYAAFTFGRHEVFQRWHWLHEYAICVGLAMLTMLAFRCWRPREVPEESKAVSPVDMTPWANRRIAVAAIAASTVVLYVTLQWLAT